MKRQNRVVFFNILSTLLLRGISFFTSPIFSRLLGTGGYGIVSTYTTWVGIYAIGGTLQTNGTLVNARIEYPEEEQPKYQSSVMTLSLLFFVLCTCVGFFFRGPLSKIMKLDGFLLALVALQSFGSFCNNFLHTRFTYEMKAGRNMVLSVGTTLALFALSLVLVLMMPEEVNYYGRIVGMAIVYGAIGIGVCTYTLWRGRTFYNKKYWTLCLTLCLPVVFYNLSDLLLGHSDLVMLRHILGDDASGIYGYAFTFGGIMYTIFTALNNSWLPFFFEDMKHGRRESVDRQAKNYLELFTVLSVGFVLLYREVFHAYAHQDFWPGTGLVPLFVASHYLNFLCTFPVNFEHFHKKVKVTSATTVFCAVLNIALNYGMIRWVGIAGAAIATLISHSIQFGIHYVYCRRLRKEDYPFSVGLWLKYLGAFVAVVVLAYLTPKLWLLRWALGAALGLWELRRIKLRKGLL